VETRVRRSVLCLYAWQESRFSRREYVFKFNLFEINLINVIISMWFAKIKLR
jgi:hypothetical protein